MKHATPLLWLGREEAEARAPLLRRWYVEAAFENPYACDIDVAALTGGWRRALAAEGGALLTGARLRGLSRAGGRWVAETAAGRVSAMLAINAAGAWADEVAAMAGAAPLGLVPRRRTSITFDAPREFDLKRMPMVVDADGKFYVKPEGGRLLGSPADETPAPPGDAQPDESDVAAAADRIEQAFRVEVRAIRARRAGLRSFLPDGLPAVGFDAAAPGFFWLAGQGGWGVQTAPALARLAADLALGRAPEGRAEAAALDPERLV